MINLSKLHISILNEHQSALFSYILIDLIDYLSPPCKSYIYVITRVIVIESRGAYIYFIVPAVRDKYVQGRERTQNQKIRS